MASYVEQYRPQQRTNLYQTDYEGVLRGLQTRTDYWKVGVQQVQSAYEQAAGLSLTGEKNKQTLNQFMSQADEQLKKATASDVSLYDNMANAVAIYRPLYDRNNPTGKELMADHDETMFYGDQFNQIKNWRTKENGKYYSDTNAQDVMNSYQDFKDGINKKGQSALDFTDKRRSYTPYYDYQKESLDILAKCKPDSIIEEGQSSNPYYFKEVSNKTLTASKIAGCLGSMSEKGKNQRTLEMRVRYHNQPQELAKDWASIGGDDINSINKQLVQARLNQTSAQNDPKSKQYFTDLVTSLENTLHSRQSNLAAINRGDYSDIQNNFDQYASQVGMFSHAATFANAHQVRDEETHYSPNVAALQFQRQDYETQQSNAAWSRQQQRDQQQFGRDVALKQMDIDGDIKKAFFKEKGYWPSEDGEDLKGFKAGYSTGEPPKPVYTTTAEDLAVNSEGIKEEKSIREESNALVESNRLAGNSLQSALNQNSDPLLLKVLGVQNGKVGNINATPERSEQLAILNSILGKYKTIEQQNRLLPPGAPKAPNFKETTITSIREFINQTENNETQHKILNKINSIAQGVINKKLGPETLKFNHNIFMMKPVTITLTGNQKVSISPQEVAQLVQTGVSPNLTMASTGPLKGSYSYGAEQPQGTDYYYKGKKIIDATQLGTLKQKIISEQSNYLDKKQKLENNIYSVSIAEGKNIFPFQAASGKAVETKQIKDAAASYMEDILKPILGKEAWDDSGAAVVGYSRNKQLVVNLGKTELDSTKLGVNNAKVYKSKGQNMISFDAPTLESYMQTGRDVYGLQNNERVRQMHTMFEKYTEPGKFEEITKNSFQRPSTGEKVNVRIQGRKDLNGLISYYIQYNKDPSLKDDGWDNTNEPQYSSINNFEEAEQKYRQYIAGIKNQ